MARLGRNRMWTEVATAENGTGAAEAKPAERYCALCGLPANVNGSTFERFGEAFCSEAHAEEFAGAVRAARVQAAAAARPTAASEQSGGAAEAAPPQPQWKGFLKMAVCFGAPLLALVVLAGGGVALVGAAGAFLPFLVLLACPLGMYFMMRSKSGQQGDLDDKRGEK